MAKTTNYEFTKPGLDGAANIEVLDQNWDKADAAIKAAVDKANIKKNTSAYDGDIIETHLTVGARTEGAEIGDGSFVSGGTQRGVTSYDYTNQATGKNSAVVGGAANKANASNSALLGGFENTAKGNNVGILGGSYTKVNSDLSCSCGGQYNTVQGARSALIGGGNNKTLYFDSVICGGTQNTANGELSFIGGGFKLTAGHYQGVFGRHNKEYDGPSTLGDTQGSLFIIGCGNYSVPNNAFRVDAAGNCYGAAAFNASGADYAEYFEWADGNPNDEDRRGIFVTLDGEKIRPAEDGDYILGVVSAMPSIAGDAQSETWKDMYLRDIYGDYIRKKTVVPESKDEVSGEIIPEHEEIHFVVNPEYDSMRSYIGRNQRKEWTPIGLVGKLVVVDDGTCEINGYCGVAAGGVAKAAESGYRVLSRLDETHIKILLR